MTIALELMSEMVELAYPIKIREDPVVLELTDEEEEVIEYISGYIIHKLRSRHSKAAEILSDVEPSGLVGQLTRGGLTMPTVEFTFIVRELEDNYRRLSTAQLTREAFASSLTCFEPLSVILDTLTPEESENFFADCVNLFFTMRMGQTCRKVLQQQAASVKKRPTRDYLDLKK